MDITRILDEGLTSGAFPLDPCSPFLWSDAVDAVDAGMTWRNLDALVTAGLVRRALKSVYVSTEVEDDLSLRGACLRLVSPPDAIVTDRHAGWLHGAEMVLAPGEHLELRPVSLFLPPGHGRRTRNDLARGGERQLPAGHVTEVEGVQVTTLVRTAQDLGCRRWVDEAICGLDALHRVPEFPREEFLHTIEWHRGRRWVTTLRATAPLADGRAESPPEGVLRMRAREAGLSLEPQHELWHDGVFIARLDLADPARRYAAEYDGAEWHSSPLQLARDRKRRRLATELGWTIDAFRKEDVFSRSRRADQVLRRRAAEMSSGPRADQVG